MRYRVMVLTKLKNKPSTYLNTTRLKDVCITRRDTEVHVVNIHVCRSETPPIEKVKEFSAYFEVSCFRKLCLLHQAEILCEERLSSQATVGRCSVAEESRRIGIIRGIRWIDCDAIEREGRRVTKIWWT